MEKCSLLTNYSGMIRSMGKGGDGVGEEVGKMEQ